MNFRLKYKIIIFLIICFYIILDLWKNNYDEIKYTIKIINNKLKKPNLTENINIINITNYSDKIPILTYHYIENDRTARRKKSSLCISKTNFNKQIKWLKKNGYITLSCEEIYLWYIGKLKLNKKSLMITFDDGELDTVKYGSYILRKYNMKGTFFIIGKNAIIKKKRNANCNLMNRITNTYRNIEFQSHTFDLHRFIKDDYQIVLKDASLQKKYFNFKFLAYPYGRFTENMIKAYNKSGIKLAFTFGKSEYARRNQSIYKIKRIMINAKYPFSKFLRWFNNNII